MSFYRDILTKAWSFVKANHYLWFLGLFAAFLAGNGGEIDLYFKSLASLTESTSFLSPNFWLNDTLAKVITLIQTNFSWPWVLIALVLGVAAIWLIITSQIGLIYSAGAFSAKGKLNLKTTIKNSQSFLWPVFSLNLLAKIIVYVSLLVLALPWLAAYIQTQEQIWMILYLITSFIILVPLAIIVSFLSKYAAGYIILRKKRLIPALGLAARLFWRNWLVSIEMAFIIFVLNLLISLLLLLLVFLFTSPYLLASLISGALGSTFSGITLFVVLGFCLLVVAAVFIGAIFSAFQWSAWTYLFVELSAGRGQAKIIRWFKK